MPHSQRNIATMASRRTTQSKQQVGKRGTGKAKRGRKFLPTHATRSSAAMQSQLAVSTNEEFSTMHNIGTIEDHYNNGHPIESEVANGSAPTKDLIYEELFGDVVNGKEKTEKRKPGPKSKKSKRVSEVVPENSNTFEREGDQISEPRIECPDPKPAFEKAVKPGPKSKKWKPVPVVMDDFVEPVDLNHVAQPELDEATVEMIGEELDRCLQEEISQEVEDIAPQTEEIPPQSEDIAPQTEEILPQTEEIPSQTEEIPSQTEEIPSQTEEIASQTEDIPPQSEEILPPTQEILPQTEEIPSETEEIPPTSEDEEVPPGTAEDMDISAGDVEGSVQIEDVTETLQDFDTSAYINVQHSPSVVHPSDTESDEQSSLNSTKSFVSSVEFVTQQPSTSKVAAAEESRTSSYVPYISARRALHSDFPQSSPDVAPLEPAKSVLSFLRLSPSAPTLKRKADELIEEEQQPKRTKTESFFSRYATPVLNRLRGRARAVVVEDDSSDEGIVLDAGDLNAVGADDVVGKEEMAVAIPMAEPANKWCVLM